MKPTDQSIVLTYDEFLLESANHTDEVEKLKDYFREHYSHVSLQGISDKKLKAFLNRKWMNKYSFEKKMDLVHDAIVSQGHADVTP